MANKSKTKKLNKKMGTKTKAPAKTAKAKVNAKAKVKVKAKAKSKPVVKAKAKPKAKVVAKKNSTKKASAKKVTAPKKKVLAAKKPAAKPAIPQKVSAPKIITSPKKVLKLADYSKVITPLADRLVIRVVETEKVTPGGIIIPDSVSTVAGHLEGEVLAVGHGSKNKKGNVKALDVKVGDFVLFSEYSGTKVEFNSEELQIIKESDVMGIVQK